MGECHSIIVEPIAHLYGSYPEKFGAPRQAGLVSEATGVIHFTPRYRNADFLLGIEHYTHLWLTFHFHKNRWNGKPTVRPQRLGGNRRMGLFATRSSFRPNGLGLSAVRLEAVDYKAVTLTISGHDLIDGTPILCIKPYIPFADALDAESTFAPAPPKRAEVVITKGAEERLKRYNLQDSVPFIESVLAQDPAPKFHHDPKREYGMHLTIKGDRYNLLFTREGAERITLQEVEHIS